MNDLLQSCFDVCHVAIPSFIGSVPIPFFTSTERSIPGVNIWENFVCYLSVGGTGFVAAKCRGDWKFQYRQIAGLILTAAHCVIDILTDDFTREEVFATFNPERHSPVSFEVVPLLSCTRLPRKDTHYSETTQANYAISNDIAVCLLLGNPDLLTEVNFIDADARLSQNSTVLISGHPLRNQQDSYIYPSVLRKALPRELSRHFFQYYCQINSCGKLKSASDSLIEVKCSGASGMSGSPMLINSSSTEKGFHNYSIAGIYVGGPPIPGQFELYELCKSYYRGRAAEEIESDFNKISTKEANKFVENPFTLLSARIFVGKKFAKSALRFTWAQEVTKFKPLVEGDMNYYYNCGIPVTSESFKEALRFIEIFKIWSTETSINFNDRNEILEFIYQ